MNVSAILIGFESCCFVVVLVVAVVAVVVVDADDVDDDDEVDALSKPNIKRVLEKKMR